MKIGIIGHGHVGQAMNDLFKDAIIYDEPKKIGTRDEINKCDIAFICVPTPMSKDGSCDTSIVENVVEWCRAKVLVLRSTIKIGFTDELKKKYKKRIVFQPEYYGETVAHPFANLSDRQWLSFGGDPKDVNLAIKAYQTVTNSNIHIYQAPAKEVEMAKYMENCFFATKVIFCNEMFDLCQKMKIDYNQVREIWIADPRIGRSHTFVYEDNRGYGGSCLPKDIASLQYQFNEEKIDSTLLNAVIKKNNLIKKAK